MTQLVFAALVIVVALIVLFSRFFKKVLDSKRQKVVIIIASILLFVGCMAFSLDSVTAWTPLRDFYTVTGETGTGMVLFHVLVLLTYASCGFSAGCGFLQVTQTTMDRAKDSDMSMGQKRSVGRLLRALEYYFMVVVSVLVARLLLDAFGALYAEPEVELVLNLMTVWPFLWLFLGLLIGSVKFWRDRKFNADFSLKRVQKFMAADKVYFHRVLIVLWFVLSTWVFFLMEFFTPAYPGLSVFSAFALIGYLVNKEPLGFS
ncbi:MAG: hypothetical protein JW839_00320 [Candidatus Lokiarchaeota archaeon]|nr:hypothetical protein [Candidatus Lokiarchaeota archaeon]